MSVPCCRCLLPCFTLPLDAQLPPTPLKLVSFLQESFRPAGPQAGCRPRWVISTLGGAITCAVQRGRWACRRSSAVGESCIFWRWQHCRLGQHWPRAVAWMVRILTKLSNCETTFRFCKRLVLSVPPWAAACPLSVM